MGKIIDKSIFRELLKAEVSCLAQILYLLRTLNISVTHKWVTLDLLVKDTYMYMYSNDFTCEALGPFMIIFHL